jgi:response regulator RpfG family c-di-GMP phosphodiesterase
MSEKLLFVDDDPNILAAYQRTLRKQYSLDTALGGEEGLSILAKSGPYAVVVSDMRMPGMNGVQFLTQVRESSPDTVRVMLTGQADMQDTILAVNEGNIFRFLTKPCDSERLIRALQDCFAQYHLVIAERELLEKTLHGSIKVLTDVLGLVNPAAFSRADRLKRYLHHLAASLNLPDAWQFELAAMLSQIGYVTVPQETLQKFFEHAPLTPEEHQMIVAAPALGKDLLANIPRLEKIALIIHGQNESSLGTVTTPLAQRDRVQLGVQLLQIALRYDELILHDRCSHRQAIKTLQEQPELFDPVFTEVLAKLEAEGIEQERQALSIYDLRMDMILDQDIKTKKGVLLVSKGQSVNQTLFKCLQNYASRDEIPDQIQVLVPKPAD